MDTHFLKIIVNHINTSCQASVDYRPKTLDKLRNVVQQRNRVLYVSLDAFEVLIDSKIPVHIVDGEDILKSLSELDTGIAEYATSQRNRTVSVIPCDLKEQLDEITSKIKAWYSQEKGPANNDDLFAEIAEICSVDVDFAPESVVTILRTLGYIGENETGEVKYSLPDESTVQILTQLLEDWEESMRKELGVLSTNGLEKFRDKIRNAKRPQRSEKESDFNQVKVRIQGMSLIPENKSETQLTEDTKMEVSDKDSEEPLGLQENAINDQLQPQDVHALVFLSSLQERPTKLTELIECLRPVCRMTLVISPRQTLSTLMKKRQLVHLGKIPIDYTLQPKHYKMLAKILSSFKNPRTLNSCPVESDLPVAAREFMHHVFKRAENVARNRGETIIMSNQEAKRRAAENIAAYLKEIDASAKSVTERELFEQIIKYSMETACIPSEEIVSSLVEGKYIELDRQDPLRVKVKYTMASYAKASPQTDFLRQIEVIVEAWLERFKRNNEENMDVTSTEAEVRSRKRCGLIEAECAKKSKLEV